MKIGGMTMLLLGLALDAMQNVLRSIAIIVIPVVIAVAAHAENLGANGAKTERNLN